MFPVGSIQIEIEISASFVDSDLQDMISTRDMILQSDFKPRKDRRLPTTSMIDYLNQRVPGRSREIQQISKYIQNLRLGEKSPLCLHGSTGCGKTSIIAESLSFLQQKHKDFQVLYINCLSYTNIKRIYSILLEYFFSRKDKKPEQALSNLFTDPQNKDESIIRLVVLDQIDQCFNNKSFIYNVLEWAQSSVFPFGVILISNMVDFASNMESKSKSRIKFNSVIFAPYHYEELIQIVKHKYPDYEDKFNEDSIIFLAKKIASINSDVRLLQKYYNEALRRHSASKNKMIQIKDIQAIFAPQEKGIFQILKPYTFILQIFWRSPRMKNIAIDIDHYCLANNKTPFSQTQVLYLLADLQLMDVIKISKQNKNSDFYYNNWGIMLTQYAYTLSTTMQKH